MNTLVSIGSLLGSTKINVYDTINLQHQCVSIDNCYSARHSICAVNQYAPIIYNINMGYRRRFIYIKKDSIAPGLPDTDLYVTDHTLVIVDGGTAIRAINVPGATVVYLPRQLVYTICLAYRQAIKVAGIDMIAPGFEDWYHYAITKQVRWCDNVVPELVEWLQSHDLAAIRSITSKADFVRADIMHLIGEALLTLVDTSIVMTWYNTCVLNVNASTYLIDLMAAYDRLFDL